MENDSRPRSAAKYILVLVIVLILLGLVYLISLKNKADAPYKVLTPNHYTPGTTLALYQAPPPGFPEGVILENKSLDYSGEVRTAKGSQITVSYISERSMQDLLEMYTLSLSQAGWNVSVISSSPNASVMEASYKTEKILLTIAPLADNKTALTFQYEK